MRSGRRCCSPTSPALTSRIYMLYSHVGGVRRIKTPTVWVYRICQHYMYGAERYRDRYRCHRRACVGWFVCDLTRGAGGGVCVSYIYLGSSPDFTISPDPLFTRSLHANKSVLSRRPACATPRAHRTRPAIVGNIFAQDRVRYTTMRYVTYLPAVSLGRMILTTWPRERP